MNNKKMKASHSKRKAIEELLKDKNLGVKIDLGGGYNPQPGFINVDMQDLSTVDLIQDLEKFPWALPDECASLVMASHLVEHINPAGGIFLKFMNEVWRILKPQGKFMIAIPYAGSFGYWQDPTHVNGCNEATWAYFDPLEINGALYRIYKPKPWKIVESSFNITGNMEVLLEKRKLDKSYEK